MNLNESIRSLLTLLINQPKNGMKRAELKERFGKELDTLERYFDSRKLNPYIKKVGKGDKETWYITDWGIHQLDKVLNDDILERQTRILEKQTKFNRIVAFTGIVIALVTLLEFVINDFKNLIAPNNKLNIFGLFIAILLAVVLVILGNILVQEMSSLWGGKKR